VVKTPAPIMLATTSAVALASPRLLCGVTLRSGRVRPGKRFPRSIGEALRGDKRYLREAPEVAP